MTATVLLNGAFLWLTSAAVVLALSWRRIRDVWSDEPRADIKRCGEYRRCLDVLGERSEVR